MCPKGCAAIRLLRSGSGGFLVGAFYAGGLVRSGVRRLIWTSSVNLDSRLAALPGRVLGQPAYAQCSEAQE